MIESAILFLLKIIGLVSVTLVLVYTVIHIVKSIARVCGIRVQRAAGGPGQHNTPHVEHQWGEWTYAAPGDCHRIRICRQCGARSTTSIVQHVCGKWTYAAPDDCRRITTCRRCGARITGDVQHAWGEEYTAPGACQTTRTCTRCGEREIVADAHLWGEWKYDPPTSCQSVRTCRQCGKQDRRDMAYTHQWSDTIADPAAPWRQTRTCTRCGGQTVYLDGVCAGDLRLLAFMRRVTPWLAPGFAPPEVIFSHKEHPETATDASSETTCWGNQEQGFKTEHTYASVPAGFYNQQWSVAAYGLPLGCELALAADEGVGPTGPSSRTTLQIAGPAPALTNIVAAFVAEFGPKPAPLNS